MKTFQMKQFLTSVVLGAFLAAPCVHAKINIASKSIDDTKTEARTPAATVVEITTASMLKDVQSRGRCEIQEVIAHSSESQAAGSATVYALCKAKDTDMNLGRLCVEFSGSDREIALALHAGQKVSFYIRDDAKIERVHIH